MELGNMAFGNSRGCYEVDRGLQERFATFFEDLGLNYYGWPEQEWCKFEKIEDKYGAIYYKAGDCEVFPYWWGDCECGFDDKMIEWENQNKHEADCYRNHPLYIEAMDLGFTDKERKKAKKLYKELHKIYGLEWGPGWAVKCTCDYKEKYREFMSSHDHEADCPELRPNFRWKDFELSWYKYPLRDSYSNIELDKELLKKIIAEVLAEVMNG